MKIIKEILIIIWMDKIQSAYKMGLSWYEKGVKLNKVRFLINNELQLEDLKKELSKEQKEVKLLKNRARNIIRILVGLLMPMSMDELIEFMEFKSKSSFRDDYIKPLKDNGLIVHTIPDKPNDPNQKYVIGEKGKMFLGGLDI